MNINKSIVLGAVIACSVVSMASAQYTLTNHVYFTGSTAARNSTMQAIADPGTFPGGVTTITQGEGTNSDGTPVVYYKSTYANFYGVLNGDSSTTLTIVKTHWSGSEAGIQDLVGGTEAFLADNATNNPTTVTQNTDTETVDLVMADNKVTFSRNPTAPLTGVFTGIIPFAWVREVGSYTDITNITSAQARVLFAGGAQAALVTGNPADTNYLYITGRDVFSGTHVNTLGDTGFGLFGHAKELKVNSDGSMFDPDGTQTYVGFDTNSPGLYGYSSGSSVAAQMGYSLSQSTSLDEVNNLDINGNPQAHFSVVGYLGRSDANTAISNGGTEISFNGVLESTTAVEQGAYSYWGNEFIYHRTSGTTTPALNLYNILANTSTATGINGHADGSTFINLNNMSSTRQGPLSDPGHD